MVPESSARIVCFAALAASVGGCQLVFGIGDYEADGPVTVGGSSGSIGGEGQGATGAGSLGGEAAGGAGQCACGLDAVWSPVNLASRGGGTDPVPTMCGDTSEPLNLFVGPPTVSCASCGCAPGGCELPGLLCYGQSSCQGTPVQVSPGPGNCTGMPGGGCTSYAVAGEVGAPACEPSGGQPIAVGSFDQFLSFCRETSCDEGCAAAHAECVMASGLPAAACPSGFDHRHVLDDGGDASCEACSCEGSCDGPSYVAGVFGCTSVSIEGTTCTGPGYPTYFAHAVKSASCTTNHDRTFAGSFEISGQHTICCRERVDDVPEVN